MGAKLKQRNGAYYVVVHHHGRRKWKKIGQDKREAQRVVHRINAQLALGEFSMHEDVTPTVGAALSDWYTTYKPTFSASYAQLAEINIRLHLVPAFGSLRIDEIEERHLLDFVRAKTESMERPLQTSTLRNILSVLRRVLSLAVERGEIKRNPCARLSRVLGKIERHQSNEVRQVSAWSRAEVATLLEVAAKQEPVLYPLLTFLFSTGARRGEALGLKWEDINFDEARIDIRRAWVRGRLAPPKSGKARSVVMSDGLAQVLHNLFMQRRKKVLSAGWKTVPEFVFCSETGGPLDERNVGRSWDRLRRKAQQVGVRPLRLHDARHTFASLALAAGTNIAWVSSQLGHANPEITLRFYAHVIPDEQTDLGFLDFGGTKRHPDGTGTTKAAQAEGDDRASHWKRKAFMERETGIEPATLSLGS